MMGQESDEDRIRRKAHELWNAEGQPHGRDRDHWDQAREMVAIEDSQKSTLLPRNTGADEPVEDRQAATNYGDVPNLTDQGDHMLTDTSREPSFAPTAKGKRKTAKDAGQPDAVKAAKTPKVIDKTAQTASIVAGSKASSRKPASSGKVN